MKKTFAPKRKNNNLEAYYLPDIQFIIKKYSGNIILILYLINLKICFFKILYKHEIQNLSYDKPMVMRMKYATE